MHLYDAESNFGFSKGRDHYVTLLQCFSSLRSILKILSSGARYALTISLHLFSFKDT